MAAERGRPCGRGRATDRGRVADPERPSRTHPPGAQHASPASDLKGDPMKTAHIRTELPGPIRQGHSRARRGGDVPVLPEGLPVRHGPRAGRRGLGRGREPLPRFRGGHRRVQHGAQPSAGGPGDQGRRGQVPPHLLGLLARRPGAPRRAHQRARSDGRARDVLLRPERDRGRGRRHQAGPSPHGPRPVHRLPGRVPRTEHGQPRVHGEQVHRSSKGAFP